ncbi:hypothetical protein [Streptacidiphilus sp. EB129]|uniref:hypothetical protein n=1 Tax=Streptacidiphilus sp. EB129 TaxID=3156262 RepID=UPI00351565E9
MPQERDASAPLSLRTADKIVRLTRETCARASVQSYTMPARVVLSLRTCCAATRITILLIVAAGA